MSGRQGALAREARLEIGQAVRAARAAGAAWKLLECRYDRDRTQLWRYAREADATKKPADATSSALIAPCGGPDGDRRRAATLLGAALAGDAR